MSLTLHPIAIARIATAVGAIPGCHLRLARSLWRQVQVNPSATGASAPPTINVQPSPGTDTPIEVSLSGRAPDENHSLVDLECRVVWTDDPIALADAILAAIARRLAVQRTRALHAIARRSPIDSPAISSPTSEVAHLYVDRSMLHSDVAKSVAEDRRHGGRPSTSPMAHDFHRWSTSVSAAHRSMSAHDGMATLSASHCTVTDSEGVPAVHRPLSFRDSDRRETMLANGPRILVPDPPTLPQAVLAQLPGRPLADVIDAPGIYGRRTIRSARTTGKGLSITLASDLFPLSAIADLTATQALALLADDDASAAATAAARHARQAAHDEVAEALARPVSP